MDAIYVLVAVALGLAGGAWLGTRLGRARGDGGRDAGPEGRDRLEVSAVLVAGRKAVQQIFDGVEPGALEIRGAARADAFQVLERSLERITGQSSRSLDRS